MGDKRPVATFLADLLKFSVVVEFQNSYIKKLNFYGYILL